MHVHVYKILAKYETDIQTDDPETARVLALEAVKDGKVEEVESDCKFIALNVE